MHSGRSLAGMFIKKDVAQAVAPATADKSLGSAPGVVVSTLPNAALESDVDDCPRLVSCTSSGTCALSESFLSKHCYIWVLRRREPKLQSVFGTRDDLGQQRWKGYAGEAAVWTTLSNMPGEMFFVFTLSEIRYYDLAAYMLASRSAGATTLRRLRQRLMNSERSLTTGMTIVINVRHATLVAVLAACLLLLSTFCCDCPVQIAMLNAPTTLLHYRADLEALAKVCALPQNNHVAHKLPAALPLPFYVLAHRVSFKRSPWRTL